MINHFLSVRELLNTLHRGHRLISEIFGKRKLLSYKYEDAVALLDENEEIVRLLCEKGVLIRNGQYLELDDQYLQFFEQVLGVNEEINTAYVDEHIRQIRDEFMLYYMQSDTDAEKFKYLKLVKNALKKIGRNTNRNIVDLDRNIENAFKTEPNYKIKLLKLENFKLKLVAIQDMIEQTEKLIDDDELTFFVKATDPELKFIKSELSLELTYARQHLIEIRKQIIEYINQIKYQSRFLEKLRQIKYLKDQYELSHKTNINEILAFNNALIFDTKPYYPVRPSLNILENEEIREIIKKLAKYKHVSGPAKKLAENLLPDDISEDIEKAVFIDQYSLMEKFTFSDNDLYNFIRTYKFKSDLAFADQITLYCQMVSIFDNQLLITDEFREDNGIEYALVYHQNNKNKYISYTQQPIQQQPVYES